MRACVGTLPIILTPISMMNNGSWELPISGAANFLLSDFSRKFFIRPRFNPGWGGTVYNFLKPDPKMRWQPPFAFLQHLLESRYRVFVAAFRNYFSQKNQFLKNLHSWNRSWTSLGVNINFPTTYFSMMMLRKGWLPYVCPHAFLFKL